MRWLVGPGRREPATSINAVCVLSNQCKLGMSNQRTFGEQSDPFFVVSGSGKIRKDRRNSLNYPRTGVAWSLKPACLSFIFSETWRNGFRWRQRKQSVRDRIQTPNPEVRRLFDLVRDDVLATTDRCRAPGGLTEASSAKGPLSPRELPCLKWVLDGKFDTDIGAIPGISHKTAHFHSERGEQNCSRGPSSQVGRGNGYVRPLQLERCNSRSLGLSEICNWPSLGHSPASILLTSPVLGWPQVQRPPFQLRYRIFTLIRGRHSPWPTHQ
jgi:hypothetical protein